MKRRTESPRKGEVNSYEAKANVIEDSMGKVFTSKGLRQKKTAQGYKGKVQEGKNMRYKGTCYICNKEGHKVNECRSWLKKNKKNHPQANLTDHASPSLLAACQK